MDKTEVEISQTIGLNNFVYTLYYLLKKENPKKKDIKIYKWIATYLKNKNHKKGKGFYDYRDIQIRIEYYKKSKLIQSINLFVDSSYDHFTLKD